MGEKIGVPSGSYPVRYTSGETLMTFGHWFKSNRFTTYIGLGIVTKVQKGEKLDIVKMNFGRRYAREILVYHNHARRQIYTLKKGQFAFVFGYMRKEHDTETNEYRTIMLAYGFNAWFVPKAFDLKSYDVDDMEEVEKEQEIDMLNFLDTLIGDDEENGQ